MFRKKPGLKEKSKVLFLDGNENSFEERSVEELLEYLECKWLNIENQQVAFISTILRVYKAEVLGYMRDFVDQQHKDSPSLVAIYSGGSLAWRNLEKRFVVQTLR